MKKYVLTFLFLCFLPLTCAQAQQKKMPELPLDICGGKSALQPLKIGGFKQYPPFSWNVYDPETDKYRYEGFVVDSVVESLKELGIVRVEGKFFDSYEELLKGALHGQIDIFFTAYYVDESKAGQDYIFPAYFGNPFIVVSRATKPIDVETPADLKGLSGIIRREEGAESLIRGILPTDTKLNVVDGAETAYRALLSGQVDFMITSPYAADAESKRFKVKKQLYFGKKPLRHIKFFASFSKLSRCRPFKESFSKKFADRFANKAEAEKRMQKYIQIWADMHKDDPVLDYIPAKD